MTVQKILRRKGNNFGNNCGNTINNSKYFHVNLHYPFLVFYLFHYC